MNFAQVSRYVPLLSKWASIIVPTGCAALLSPYFSCFGSQLQNGASCGLGFLVFTSGAALFARRWSVTLVL